MRYLMPGAMLIALSSVLTSCAAKQEGAPDLGRTGLSTQSIQVAGGATAALNLVDRVVAHKAVLDLPPDRAFAALDGVYAALGIAITDRDVATKRIGNSSFRARRKIGDLLMTKIVDCGGDGGMRNAETYTVTLTVMSQVSTTDAGGSLLQTVVAGTARNPLTNAANDVQCTSVGELEGRIEQLVRAHK